MQTPAAQLLIQPASLLDLAAFSRHEKRCFSPQDVWLFPERFTFLAAPRNLKLKIDVDGEMIAFLGAIPEADATWIATISVDPDWRYLGIGERLVRECERLISADVLKLSTRFSNFQAASLYEKLGFQVIGRWPGYYAGGEDALVYMKRLRSIDQGVKSSSKEE